MHQKNNTATLATANISYFRNIHAKSAERFLTDDQEDDSIRTGWGLVETFTVARTAYTAYLTDGNKDPYSEIKVTLPVTNLAKGNGKGKGKENITEYFGKFYIDIDGITPQEAETIKERCKSVLCVRKVYLSVSGHGIRIVVLTDNRDIDKHERIFKEILVPFFENLTGHKVDTSGSNPNRLCFVSYDPNIYSNPNAVPLAITLTTEPTAKATRKSNVKNYWIDKATKPAGTGTGREYKYEVIKRIAETCLSDLDFSNKDNSGRHNALTSLAGKLNTGGVNIRVAEMIFRDLLTAYGLSDDFIQAKIANPLHSIYHQYKNTFGEVRLCDTVISIPALKPETDSGIKYLSQDSDCWLFLDNNKEGILQSVPNSGKTELAVKACRRDKVATLVLFPTCEIAEQQAERHKANLLIGGEAWTNEDLINGLNCGELFFLTYEYYSELLKRGVLNYAREGFYMFIDEAHALENQDNIRRNAIDNIVRTKHPNCLKKIYMTGTPSFTLSRSLGGLPIYKSKIANKVKLIFNICTFDSKHSNTVKATTSRMLQVKESHPDVVQLCRYNNKGKAIEITERLRSQGQNSAPIFGARAQKAYPDPLSELVRESVRLNETIPDGVDFVNCTSVWDTGVNIRNKNVRAVLAYDGRVGFEAYNMYQFVSRFREVETLEVDIIISDNNLKKEGTDLDELIQSISELYDTKVNQYEIEAQNLKGESVSELYGRTPHLIDLRPRYGHDGTGFYCRTTHAGNECQREFSRGLTVPTGLTFLQNEYNCIQSAEVKTIKERETYYDQSAKDKEALEAIAVISEMLKDAKQRRYLYALAVADGGEQLVRQINMFDPAFSYTYAKDNILPTAEYREWFKKHERTLNVGAYMERVRQFVGYMVCINHVESSANWVKEYSDTTKANAQNAKVNLAVHRFIESESDLKEAYRRDARNELEREKINDILTIASQYVGKEYGVSELWALILSQYKDADRLGITERQILRMVKAGYQYEERKDSKAYYITLTRRTELADVVGTELESNVKDTISAMVKGVRGNDSNIITNPLTPFTTKPEPEPVETVASVETVQVIARQTVEVPEPTPPQVEYKEGIYQFRATDRVVIQSYVNHWAGS